MKRKRVDEGEKKGVNVCLRMGIPTTPPKPLSPCSNGVGLLRGQAIYTHNIFREEESPSLAEDRRIIVDM